MARLQQQTIESFLGEAVFKMNERLEKVFQGGKEDWNIAEKAAMDCGQFKADVEEERVSDELISCYNCRYRRWTVESFNCMKSHS